LSTSGAPTFRLADKSSDLFNSNFDVTYTYYDNDKLEMSGKWPAKDTNIASLNCGSKCKQGDLVDRTTKGSDGVFKPVKANSIIEAMDAARA
jgi:hypothetical protein